MVCGHTSHLVSFETRCDVWNLLLLINEPKRSLLRLRQHTGSQKSWNTLKNQKYKQNPIICIYTLLLFIYKKCSWGNLLISFFTIMFHKVLNLAPSLLVKSSAFRHTITCYHLTCLPYKQVNLEHSTTFTVFCCRCPNLIEKCCCHEIYKKHNCTKIHRVLNIKQLYHWVWWCIILTQLKCVYVTPRWWIKTTKNKPT